VLQKVHLKPVIPFEPVSADSIPGGEQWTAQVKWDGVRVLTYFDGHEVSLYNRKMNERTMQYPELTDISLYCSASSVILDGEVIALSGGKPSFHSVMKRDGIRQPDKVGRARKDNPVVYMVFDVLYCDGEWMFREPLFRRQQIIAGIITPMEGIQPVENFDDMEGLFDVIKAQGMEGIVCKDITSGYAVGGKDRRWQKIKNYRDLTAVIGGVTFRGNIISALLLGQYDREGRLWYIGHAGTGKLKQEEWRALTGLVRPMTIKQRPFVNKPERVRNAVWVEPRLTVKVKFAEWTGSHTMRQPSIQAVIDIRPEECILE